MRTNPEKQIPSSNIRYDDNRITRADEFFLQELGRHALDGFLDTGRKCQLDGAHATSEGELAADTFLRGDRIKPRGAGAQHGHMVGKHTTAGQHD
jgi:hypothetical protein